MLQEKNIQRSMNTCAYFIGSLRFTNLKLQGTREKLDIHEVEIDAACGILYLGLLGSKASGYQMWNVWPGVRCGVCGYSACFHTTTMFARQFSRLYLPDLDHPHHNVASIPRRLARKLAHSCRREARHRPTRRENRPFDSPETAVSELGDDTFSYITGLPPLSYTLRTHGHERYIIMLFLFIKAGVSPLVLFYLLRWGAHSSVTKNLAIIIGTGSGPKIAQRTRQLWFRTGHESRRPIGFSR